MPSIARPFDSTSRVVTILASRPGIAVRRAGDQQAEPDVLGLAGEVAEGRVALQHRLGRTAEVLHLEPVVHHREQRGAALVGDPRGLGQSVGQPGRPVGVGEVRVVDADAHGLDTTPRLHSQRPPSTRHPTVTTRNTPTHTSPGTRVSRASTSASEVRARPRRRSACSSMTGRGAASSRNQVPAYAASDCTCPLPHHDTAKTAERPRPARRRARRSCGSAAAAAPAAAPRATAPRARAGGRSRYAAPSPSSAGPTYPANAVATMPGPRGPPPRDGQARRCRSAAGCRTAGGR